MWLLLESMAIYNYFTYPSGVQGENAAEQDSPLGFFNFPQGSNSGLQKRVLVRVIFLKDTAPLQTSGQHLIVLGCAHRAKGDVEHLYPFA